MHSCIFIRGCVRPSIGPLQLLASLSFPNKVLKYEISVLLKQSTKTWDFKAKFEQKNIRNKAIKTMPLEKRSREKYTSRSHLMSELCPICLAVT